MLDKQKERNAMNILHSSGSRLGIVILFALLLLPVGSSVARADQLDGLLLKGPVVMLEQADDGKFKKATSVIKINAPIEKVWEAVIDFARYKEIFPKCKQSKVLKQDAVSALVRFEIEVPLVNTKYEIKYKIVPEKRKLIAKWAKGDLKGSHWIWLLKPAADGGTVVYYAGVTKSFSAILERMEDDQQTITIGVNVASLIASLRAVKQWVEKPAS